MSRPISVVCIKAAVLVVMAIMCNFSILAQQKFPFKEKLLKPLEEGKGYVIENLEYFKEEVLGKLGTIDSLFQTDSLRARIEAKVDSLKGVLEKSGNIVIPESDLILLPLIDLPDPSVKVMANLVFSLRWLGGTKSLNYEIKKGDTLFITYRIMRGAGFDEMEVLEGKELRFSTSLNKKDKDVEAAIVATADGVLAINLLNKGILPSKGKLLVIRHEVARQLSVKYECDTLFQQVKVKRMMTDTIQEMLYDDAVHLSSTKNITQPNTMRMQIPFTKNRKYIAWAFWLGSDNQTKEEWAMEATAETVPDPLTRYLLNELDPDDAVWLPEDRNKDLRISMQHADKRVIRSVDGKYIKTSVLAPTANNRANFAAFIVTGKSGNPSGVQMTLQNTSKVYDYKTKLNIVGLYTDSYEVEEEVTEKSCINYVIVSVI